MMIDEVMTGTIWSRARFGDPALRARFLEQVRVWNYEQELPDVEVEPLADGLGVKFRVNRYRQVGLLQLIEAHGGKVTFHLDSGVRWGLEPCFESYVCG